MLKGKILIAIFLIGFLGVFITKTGISNAGSNRLTTNEPECGHIYTLAIDPKTPSTIYAGTLYGGVFKSTNGGESWTDMTNMNPQLTNKCYVKALAIDPKTPSTIYAGTGYSVFKSTNGGVDWTAMNTGLTTSYPQKK